MGRERQFINERLVTAGRFKPGVPGAPGPGGGTTDATAVPAGAQEPPTPPPPETGADLPHLLRREHAALHSGLRRERDDEFRRRRQEVCGLLAARAAACAEAQRDAGHELERLQLWQERLSPAAALDPERADEADLRAARRQLEEVHLELLRLQRDHAAATDVPRTHPLVHDLLSLSFAQVTRLGLGLLWPLAVAVLLGALLLAACFLALFRMA
jgi:hypothetical protein